VTIDDVLNDLRNKISTKLPKGITISDLEFEGPELVIYTTEPKAFADNGDIIRSLAKDLRKRIVVRPDPKMLLDAEQSIDKIKQIVPQESGLSNFFFDMDTGEVIIEAEKPGLVIGRHGSTLREITKRRLDAEVDARRL
jgi:predicted metal-dependent RNase